MGYGQKNRLWDSDKSNIEPPSHEGTKKSWEGYENQLGKRVGG
jgi:hypothetical protein